MLIYLFFLLFTIGMILLENKFTHYQNQIIWYIFLFVVLVFVSSAEYLGPDRNAYIRIYNEYNDKNINQLFSNIFNKDILSLSIFYFLSKNYLSLNIYYLITSFLLVFGISRLANLIQYKWLYLLLCLPYFIFIVSINYPRQAGAIGLILISISYILRNKTYKSILPFVFAISIHRSAVIFLGVISLFDIIKNRNFFIKILIYSIISIVLFFALYQSIVTAYNTYISLEMFNRSSGSFVRCLQLLIIFSFSLIIMKFFKIKLNTNENILFYIFLIFSFFLTFSSLFIATFADRLNLFLFPIAYFFLIKTLNRNNYPIINNLLIICMMTYSILQFSLWFQLSSYNTFWIPYNSVLW